MNSAARARRRSDLFFFSAGMVELLLFNGDAQNTMKRMFVAEVLDRQFCFLWLRGTTELLRFDDTRVTSQKL